MASVLAFKSDTNVVRLMGNRFAGMDEEAIIVYVKRVLSPMIESGNRVEALVELDEIVNTVSFEDKPQAVAAALGARIVLNKHLWQNTSETKYLSEMQKDVYQGVRLNIPDHVRAQFFLRDADVSASIGDRRAAEIKYEMAYQCVTKGGREEAEYLGHYGEALASNGKATQGLIQVQRALRIMEDDNTGTPEERLILSSGLYGRLAKCAFKSLRFILAIQSYRKGKKQAEALAYQYGMPQRLNQYRFRWRGKGE